MGELFIDHPKYRLLILWAISFVATWLVFKPLLKIARKANVLDNPDARKLQKQPVPVLGGAAVFFGIIMGMSFFKTMHAYTSLFPVIGAMVIMLYIGIIDDILTIKPWKRFVMEILVALLIVFGNRFVITNMQGLWGVESLPVWLGVVLSVITYVGVVNAINMIDGVDGLSSGMCIFIFTCFGLVFFMAHDYSYAALCAVCIGALMPFFLHNVFGWTSKMFIGDGGTMVLGTVISAMVFELLRGKFHTVLVGYTAAETSPVRAMDFSLVAFCLAVLALPIADTLRVMVERLFEKRSPFSPDKKHLHHLLIGLGFSYIFTTITEIVIAVLTVLVFVAVWMLGGSVEVQLYCVVGFALVVNIGMSILLRSIKPSEKVEAYAAWTHVERKGLWLWMQKVIDK